MRSRKAAALAASAVMLASQFGVPAAAAEVPETEELTASRVAEEMGIGIILGNTFEAYNASGCEKSTYTWMTTVGSNTPKDDTKGAAARTVFGTKWVFPHSEGIPILRTSPLCKAARRSIYSLLFNAMQMLFYVSLSWPLIFASPRSL